MSTSNYYDVTDWAVGNPVEDIGEVINSIIAEIKTRQTIIDEDEGGKSGALIYIPPGNYRLRTQVVIDISFLKIQGSNHGFTSSSIRFNIPSDEWSDLHELWPGGSRILVDLPALEQQDESAGAAFSIERSGSPRISAVEFANFCIDGLHYIDDGSELLPENTYINGKTGIYAAGANDSLRITEMGFVYLEHAITLYNVDALSIHDNFIAECGSCIELRGWGQASKITDNLIGAGFKGYSIYAENHGGLLITANNIFPRGSSSVHLSSVARSSISNNRFHSFYPGMVILGENSTENLVGSNHFLRDREPWTPFLAVDNGLDDLYGLLRVNGSNNSIIGNHFSLAIDFQSVRPTGEVPIIVRLVEGNGNYVSSNHVVATDVNGTSGDSAFSAQVGALLATNPTQQIAVTTVLVDLTSDRNVILDSGEDGQVILDRSHNVFRAMPALGEPPREPGHSAPSGHSATIRGSEKAAG